MVTYPKDWQESKLLDHVDLVQGLTYTPENVKPYGTLVLRSSNIQNGRLSLNDNVYVNARVPEEKMVQSGDILVCVRNGSSALIGKSCVLPKLNHTTFGAFMSVLRGDTTGYFAKVFESNIVQEQVRGRSNATINQITKKDFQSILVTVPFEPEQKEIARTLSYFDTYIDDLSELIEKKRSIRDGALEDLMSGRTRLSGFTGERSEKELCALSLIVNGDRGINYPSEDAFIPFGIPFVNAGHLENGKINWKEMNYISEERYRLLGGGKIQKGDILFCLRGSLGKYALADFSGGAPASSLCIIRAKENTSAEFLSFVMASSTMKNSIELTNTGSSQPNLSAKDISHYVFNTPDDINEQIAIAEVLKSMDEEIEALETERDKMIQIREGAMDDLLIGRVRLSM